MRKRFVLLLLLLLFSPCFSPSDSCCSATTKLLLTDVLEGNVVEDVAQVGEVGVVDVEHVKVLVGLGQVDGQPLEDRIEVDVVVARAADDAGAVGVLEALAGREEVRGRAGAGRREGRVVAVEGDVTGGGGGSSRRLVVYVGNWCWGCHCCRRRCCCC